MRIYFDTSALAKRYDFNERGSSAVQLACAPKSGNRIFISDLVSVEIASSIGRKVREGIFDSQFGVRSWELFQEHWKLSYQVVRCSQTVVRRAEQLVFDHPLRAIDAIHVATALDHLRIVTDAVIEFWTADSRQARAAEAEGLTVNLVA